MTETEVREALAAERILASPAPGLPRHLMLRELRFSGEKVDVPNDGPFEFVWSNLDHGLYAVATEKNLRGKSSIVEIVRWLLRGRSSDLLQADVYGWIHEASLIFSLDAERYEVRVIKKDGFAGSLFRISEEGEKELVSFSSSSEFERAMTEFFLRELSLEEMTVWTRVGGSENEKAVVHSWPALAGVLYIGTDYNSLLGDVPVTTGLSARLLQMFLGLPWVSTVTTTKAARDGIQAEQSELSRKEKGREAERQNRRSELETALEEKQAHRASLPESEDITARYRSIFELIRGVNQERLAEEAALNVDKQDVRDAKDAYDRDRKELRQYIDSKTAGAIFRQIEPSCCPRCETSIRDERMSRETADHRCFVCGEGVETESGADAFQAAVELSERASGAAYSEALGKLELRTKAIDELATRYADLVDTLAKLDAEAAAAGEAKLLEIEIAILTGQLKEVHYLPAMAEASDSDLSILNAVLNETEALMKERQDELLKAVSEKMLEYAKRFGIEALTLLRLKGNLNLEVHKGGDKTSYSKVTPGEQLRLKVAAVLALISVADTEGIGRHPGLLLIDSLAAQEINVEDLDQLVSGLEEIASEIGHLQIFVASLLSKAIQSHISEDHLLVAQGDEALW